jgi:murein L,D-transpeptidase YcbB/YkuD
MTNRTLLFLVLMIVIALAGGSCTSRNKAHNVKALNDQLNGAINQQSNIPFDSNLVAAFFKSYPALAGYEHDVVIVYREHHHCFIWFDNSGMVEFAQSLYNKVKDLSAEGISARFPYEEKMDAVFDNDVENTLTKAETELMLTSLYLFYAEKVYKGIDEDTTTTIGWLLPRKQMTYTGLLDSVMLNPQLLDRDEKVLFRQYYWLRDVLQRYREIERQGGWNPIDLDPKLKAYKPGDTAKAIAQIRDRLFITGDIRQNNHSNKYDPELAEGVKKYQKRNGNKPGDLILPKHIQDMNVPIGDRIKKIIVNMERCRWISPELIKAKEMIVVNIPSFKLNFYRDGKSELESPVIVGTNVTKTVIFSGKLSYIVFSPYWNVPQSIIVKEVKPGMAKNKNYLEKHNMEWNNGQVRQKPGKNNSLGLVKFIFPNSNDIYMHDTPAKSLFEKESRAFSHGCIRVGKPRDLALCILKDDKNWTPGKIDAAMHAGTESAYPLKNRMPVYIGYFTAFVDEQGEINFYDDIYDRDERLAKLLFYNP